MDHAESNIKHKSKTRTLEASKRVIWFPTEIQWKSAPETPLGILHLKRKNSFRLNVLILEPPALSRNPQQENSPRWDVCGGVGGQEGDPNSLDLCVATGPCTAFPASSLCGELCRMWPFTCSQGILGRELQEETIWPLCGLRQKMFPRCQEGW